MSALVRSRLIQGKFSTIFKNMSNSRPSSDMSEFKKILSNSNNVLILTGAGVSAESGIPTFRGAGGYWRQHQATKLATPEAFKANPSLVWEFYHYRREIARQCVPNQAHLSIAEFEKRAATQGKTVTVVTQNIDNLHARAGSRNIIELHGNLYKTRCTKCKNVQINHDSPICEALAGRGLPNPEDPQEEIPLDKLPRCSYKGCTALLRPHIVWFGENLELANIEKAKSLVETCDLCLVIGTSSVVYPAAMFAPQIADRGVTVAEFNIEPTPVTDEFGFYFQGKCGTTVPQALD